MEDQSTVLFAGWWRCHGHLGSDRRKAFGCEWKQYKCITITHNSSSWSASCSSPCLLCFYMCMYCALLSCIVANLHSIAYLFHIAMVLFKGLNQISWWNCASFIAAINCWFCLHLVNSKFSNMEVFSCMKSCYKASRDQHVFMCTTESPPTPHNRDKREWLGINALLVNFSFVRVSISSFVF